MNTGYSGKRNAGMGDASSLLASQLSKEMVKQTRTRLQKRHNVEKFQISSLPGLQYINHFVLANPGAGREERIHWQDCIAAAYLLNINSQVLRARVALFATSRSRTRFMLALLLG
jgi:hypothetical protein